MEIIGLVSTIAGIVFWFIKRKAKKKTPQEKYDADREKMDSNIAHGDGMGITRQFEQLRRENQARHDRFGGPGSENPTER